MSYPAVFGHFPTARELYPWGQERRFLKQLRHVLRYFPRRVWTHQQGQAFIKFLNSHPVWVPMFYQNMHRFHTILFYYGDKRFSAKQRQHHLQYTFEQMDRLLGLPLCERLVAEHSLKLADLGEGLGLYLNLNTIDVYEGLFSINIQDHTNQRYYDASFVLMDSSTLLLVSVQGPSGDQAAEKVKLLTKHLHGMRPMFMLIECFRWLAQHWGLSLVGIPHVYQPKVRCYGSQKIYLNYDEFWQENGGVFKDGYWQLPLQVERKSLSDVVSKKRAMYRKRYELFDVVEQSIRHTIPVASA